MWFEGQQHPDTLVPEEGDTGSNVGDPDEDFVLSSDDEAGDLGSDEDIVEDSE